jgi:hypothetical protein
MYNEFLTLASRERRAKGVFLHHHLFGKWLINIKNAKKNYSKSQNNFFFGICKINQHKIYSTENAQNLK